MHLYDYYGLIFLNIFKVQNKTVFTRTRKRAAYHYIKKKGQEPLLNTHTHRDCNVDLFMFILIAILFTLDIVINKMQYTVFC